jgi:hypothetical protein
VQGALTVITAPGGIGTHRGAAQQQLKPAEGRALSHGKPRRRELGPSLIKREMPLWTAFRIEIMLCAAEEPAKSIFEKW